MLRVARAHSDRMREYTEEVAGNSRKHQVSGTGLPLGTASIRQTDFHFDPGSPGSNVVEFLRLAVSDAIG